MALADCDDSTLVNASLGGDREAFGQIVTRYQALIASLAYSATGNLSQSEDVAQETFVTAWKHLKFLQEPGKVRGWLCGIARRIAANAYRQAQKEPAQGAAPLELLAETPTADAPPAEHAMTREEEMLLWRTLEQIPETYREPLILYYREEHSVERVAQSLELSSEAVRQRLSRGRKLLEEQVTAFVEGALRQSAPGRSFTLGVLSALPTQLTTVGTATVTAAKGSVTTKAAAWLAVLNSFSGLFAGSLAAYLGYKTDMATASSELERKYIKRFYATVAGCVVFSTGLIFIAVWARGLALTQPGLYAALALITGLSWLPGAVVLGVWLKRGITAGTRASSLPPEPYESAARPAFEYRSSSSLLGLPLVHFRIGGPRAARRKTVKAWIAVGDIAIGGLFATGGLAIAPVAFGGFALGGVLFGGFGAGVLAYAGFALGIWAMGGVVIGVQAIGGCALGWTAAAGGIAVAHQLAQGGVALALHANDPVVQSYLSNSAFFRIANALLTTWLWPTMLLAVLPSVVLGRLARRGNRL